MQVIQTETEQLKEQIIGIEKAIKELGHCRLNLMHMVVDCSLLAPKFYAAYSGIDGIVGGLKDHLDLVYSRYNALV